MLYGQLLKKMFVSHAGARCYPMSAELELYTSVVTASMSDLFYETSVERVERIARLVGQVSPEFVARLAIYTRTVMHLRSVPLLLVVELARVHSGDDLVARTVEKTVLRADEIMELLMCYQWRSGAKGSRKKLGRLSHQLQKGLQRAFHRFDEYQFAKYDRQDSEVRLRDALFLVHPKAKDEQQQALFDRIASKQLATPYTWETELSALGQQQFFSEEEKLKARRSKWEELIGSGRLGYMAMLRSLRSICCAGTSVESVAHLAAQLSDPQRVAASKQLPFRFLAAYKELIGWDDCRHQMVMEALETAASLSAGRIEGFDEHTRVLLACDMSGSMDCPLGRHSSIKYYEIGLLLAMMMKSRCKQVVTGIFACDWETVDVPSTGILDATLKLHSLLGSVGWSTNSYKVIEWLIDHRLVMDKVMMFTDMQMWDSTGGGRSLETQWRAYKRIAPQARLYLFDLSGYGQSPISFIRHDVCLIAGWSDRIFDVLSSLEKGEDVLHVIHQVSIE